MSETGAGFQTPYDLTPGGSTPSPEVGPEEGRRELIGMAWLSVASTFIIAGVGFVAWWFAR